MGNEVQLSAYHPNQFYNHPRPGIVGGCNMEGWIIYTRVLAYLII